MRAGRILLLLLPLALGGCGGAGHVPAPVIAGSNEAEDNPFPANYRTETLDFLRTYLNDPTNVHDAFISEPVLKTIVGKTRYVVCVSYNAKKDTGEYGGSKDRVAVFYVGRFNQFIENGRQTCADVKFQPFPELERLKR